jgi:UDP-N-acetylmuramoyl-L-alanyl-D-glutamate--2,6-diaminopimelate ligase
MLGNGCEYAVLEFTSQGLEAGRHWGLDGFNATIFLNLFPEHIDAHGGLENYVKAKSILPQNTRLNGIFVSDLEAAHLDFMLQSIADRDDIKRVLIDFKDSEKNLKDLKEFKFNELEKFKISQSKEGYQVLNYQGKSAETNFLARFDALNLGFAWVTLLQLGLKPDLLKLSQVWGVPGRMEWVIRNGQTVFQEQSSKFKVQSLSVDTNLSIMVDYAHETESLRQLLETLDKLKKSGDFAKIIHIFSVTGSGRDIWKRPQMARVTAQISDLVIYTTEDHDAKDNLNAMQEEVVEYLRQNRAKKILTESDRLSAFKLAIDQAKTEYQNQKVLIVSTAMGSQQGMETARGVIEWDEREKWLEALEG